MLADLISSKEFERHYKYERYEVNGEQGFKEMHSGDWWKDVQGIAGTSKLLSIILYTDGIAVDFFGRTTLIPVMITLGNFPSAIQRKLVGKRLIGFVPYLRAGLIRGSSQVHPSIVRRRVMHDALNM